MGCDSTGGRNFDFPIDFWMTITFTTVQCYSATAPAVSHRKMKMTGIESRSSRQAKNKRIYVNNEWIVNGVMCFKSLVVIYK